MLQLIIDGSSPPSIVQSNASVHPFVWLTMTVVGMLVLCVIVHRALRAFRRPELHGMNRERVRSVWIEIEKTMENGIMGAKLAVIEADKLVDNVLRSMMMPGETMGERLKSAGYKYPAIGQVWGAHRLRNQLVHDSTFEISERQAKDAVRDFQHALRVLNVMD